VSAYADTSFLVSLYVLDANSESAATLMEKANLPILLTALGELELTNAISLRQFRRELSPSKVKAAHALIRKDLAEGVLHLRSLSSGAFERAKQMARKRTPRVGTRTLDILHVASAVELQAEMFYTFDRRQEKLAKAEGLLIPQVKIR
jgi:predicted nucleic acid-binding protein